MTKMRRRVLIAFALCAVITAGIGCGLLLKLRVDGFFDVGDLRHELPPCYEVGAPFHHRFRASCEGEMVTPRGKAALRTNEDGLRDSARAELLASPSRILLLGDSFVEGWWAGYEHTLSALLTSRLPGRRFVNAGLRSTGPTLQAKRLVELVSLYKPAGLIWFLNDTDGLDERLACVAARDPRAPIEAREFDTPEIALSGWRKSLVESAGGTLAGRRARLLFYEKRWADLVQSDRAKRCPPCSGIEEVKRIAEREKIPLLVYFLAADLPELSGHYSSGAQFREQTLACLAAAGITARRENMHELPAEQLERYFWKGDFHLNPEGMAYFADRILPTVSAFAAGLRPRAKR